MGMEWVRKNYGVPAKRGGRVEYTGDRRDGVQLGTLIGAKGGYVRIRLDGRPHAGSYHPTWELRYLVERADERQPLIRPTPTEQQTDGGEER